MIDITKAETENFACLLIYTIPTGCETWLSIGTDQKQETSFSYI